MTKFRNREHAGQELAAVMAAYFRERPEVEPLVLGLSRGGVPVAAEVARTLGAPLGVRVVRKLGVPWRPELGVGAVSEGGHVYLSDGLMQRLELSRHDAESLLAREQAALTEQVLRYRRWSRSVAVGDRVVVVVDDGVATGATVLAAIRGIRAEGARSVVLAVPLAAAESLELLTSECDRLCAILAPRALFAIGAWYEEFEQVDDAEVMRLLSPQSRDDMRQSAPATGG